MPGWNWQKNQAKAKQHPPPKLFVFENYSLSSYTLSSKNRRYSKKMYVYLNKVIWLMTMKMRLKMKNRSHRYDMNIATNILNRNYDMCHV